MCSGVGLVRGCSIGFGVMFHYCCCGSVWSPEGQVPSRISRSCSTRVHQYQCM